MKWLKALFTRRPRDWEGAILLLATLAACAPVDPTQQRCLYQAEMAVLPDMNINNPEAISQVQDLRGACEQLSE